MFLFLFFKHIFIPTFYSLWIIEGVSRILCKYNFLDGSFCGVEWRIQNDIFNRREHVPHTTIQIKLFKLEFTIITFLKFKRIKICMFLSPILEGNCEIYGKFWQLFIPISFYISKIEFWCLPIRNHINQKFFFHFSIFHWINFSLRQSRKYFCVGELRHGIYCILPLKVGHEKTYSIYYHAGIGRRTSSWE